MKKYNKQNIKMIVTLGPSTNTERDLRKIKDKGVDFVRINMSHSNLDDLKYFIGLARKVDIPFIVDTEGSQIRTGELVREKVNYEEGSIVKIYSREISGDEEKICLKPKDIASELESGDLILVDFNTLILKVSDTSRINEGYILARVVTGGTMGRNKSAIIVPGTGKKFKLPVLTEKDKASIEIGLKEGVTHIALSFVRCAEDVEEVRRATDNAMHIISKIEAKESLEDIDRIIEKTDSLLLDRGDLSKEIPVENVPFVQKVISKKAHEAGKEVFIATNLLESMIENKKPTKAEVNDVINTILDGVDGLILSAETAIGKHPIGCLNMMRRLIESAKKVKNIDFSTNLSKCFFTTSIGSLIEPHGKVLVDRFISEVPANIDKLIKIKMTEQQELDVEQIAIGTYSPLEGFMVEKDFRSVLDNMRLANGVIWPIPIVFGVREDLADKIAVGDRVALANAKNEIMANLHVEDKYTFNKKVAANKVYGTDDENHPGVKMLMDMPPVLLGGRIDLFKRRDSEYKEYELTPRQVRRLFEDRNWSTVAGFHTRNVIHMGHEFIQLSAMEKKNCDGLFIHPVIGRKKTGDFNAKYIIKTYEKMMKDIYPRNNVVFAVFSTFSRYAGPREAVFTAICRKNFGCSHFIVGRDHTGVGSFYHPNASHEIFDKFPDLGIEPIKFNEVFYSDKLQKYIHAMDGEKRVDFEEKSISATRIREMIKSQVMPPEWFMREEISSIILDAVKNREDVFVEEE